jgi:hypothetical protein
MHQMFIRCQVKILVADDSENPLDYLEGAEVIPLPSRTGCSYGTYFVSIIPAVKSF